MIGAGFIKQMNDALKYNKDILGKRKKIKEIYKEELLRKANKYDHQTLEDVKIRVAERIKKNQKKAILGRITSIALILILFFSIVISIRFINKELQPKPIKKESLFNVKYLKLPDGREKKIDFYWDGPKAAETFVKNGMKHQNSESYYESGQQFRSALYFYDTLITEVFFFKNGDTIKNFPKITDNEIHRLSFDDKNGIYRITLDYYDGKILSKSYRELKIKN